jgi:hypothetical protein
MDSIAHAAETNPPSEPDPELYYYQGAIFAYCGRKQAALHLLQTAIEQNYCAYTNLRTDPMLAKLRAEPEFTALLSSAKACQDAAVASGPAPSR